MALLNRVCRCLLTLLVAGIVACGKESPPPAGPDLLTPSSVVLTPDSLRLLVNQSARVAVAVLNAQGDTLTEMLVSFHSEDTTVATVDSTGLVRARAGGAVYVDVAAGNVHALLLVRVRVNGTLVVSPHMGLVTENLPLQLSTVIRDSTGALTYPPVQYRSNDTSIARVSATGRVTLNRLTGNVTIIASSDGRTDGVFVTAVLDRVGSSRAEVTGNAAGDVLIGSTGGGRDALVLLRPPAPQHMSPIIAVAEQIDGVALSVDASRAYVADGFLGKLIGVDVSTASELFAVPVYSPGVIALDPGDSVLYYASNLNVNRLNVATLDTSPLFYHGIVSRLLIRDPWMYVAGTGDVQQYNIRTRSLGKTLPNSRFTADIALSPDGGRLYFLNYSSSRVGVWDVATGDTLPSIVVRDMSSAQYLAFQPTTGLLWVSTISSSGVFVLDVVSRTVVRVFQPGGTPGGLVFTPSGVCVLGNGGGWVDFVR